MNRKKGDHKKYSCEDLIMKMNVQLITVTDKGFRRKKNIVTEISRTNILKEDISERHMKEGTLCKVEISNKTELMEEIKPAGYQETALTYIENILNRIEDDQHELSELALLGGMVLYLPEYPTAQQLHFSHQLFFNNDAVLDKVLDGILFLLMENGETDMLNVPGMNFYLETASAILARDFHPDPVLRGLHHRWKIALTISKEPISDERKTNLFIIEHCIKSLNIMIRKHNACNEEKKAEIDELFAAPQIVNQIMQYRKEMKKKYPE